jgi:hypothetical protein
MVTDTPARQVENEPWLAMPASKGLDRPPTRTKLQILPFAELDWENFERLCYRLARTYGDVDRWSVLYGARGQKQDGIDVYSRQPGSQRYCCWQSKRHKQLTRTRLAAAIGEFEKGLWADKSDEFIICTSAPIQDTALQGEIESQTDRLATKGLKLRVLGQLELSTELKRRSALVRDFFGREWVTGFCDDAESEQSASTLDVADIAELRTELRRLYSSNFSGLDPGVLAISVETPCGGGFLPLLDRFVEPDVELTETTFVRAREPASEGLDGNAHSDLDQTEHLSAGRQELPDVQRRRLSAWVSEGDRAVIAGDAGLGKSTALRVFALDLLETGRRFPLVAQRWSDYVPIVMPFAFWVRVVEKGENHVSLPSTIEKWFRQFEVSEALITLVRRSLNERKAVLLIDGLDEWSNETAARSTLELLNTYVKSTSTPSLLTGRPGGLARLGALDPIWRQARLAMLSDSQQTRLATNWFTHLARPISHNNVVPRDPEFHIKSQVHNFFVDLRQAGTLLTLSGVPLLLSGLISLYTRRVVLPRGRIQAYKELVQLLLEIHPSRRAQAALDRTPRLTILADSSLRQQTLAYLAYHKRLKGLDAGCSHTQARSIIVQYLTSLDGAGLQNSEAIVGANEILSVDADTAGLIVEKSPGEIGFIHAAFEETLAGLHIASWDLRDQEAFVNSNAGDPRWTTSILTMLHTLTRPSDIDHLLRLVVPSNLLSATDVVRQGLVAEAIFGEFKCSPRLVGELAPAFIEIVTTETWFPLRRSILHLILEAGASGRMRALLHSKLDDWFPDPVLYRTQIYPTLSSWPRDEAIGLLWMGLFNEDDSNKSAAGAAIADIFAGDASVGQRLFDLCHTVAEAETLCASIEALMSGWWDDSRLRELISSARRSDHIGLRLAGIRGKILAARHDGADLDELLFIAERERLSFAGLDGRILHALTTGWPNDPTVIAACLDSTRRNSARDGMNPDVAKRYLLHFAQLDGELDNRVANLIRADEYFFSHTLGTMYAKGTFGPEIRSAIDYRLDNIKEFQHNDAAHLAIMSGSEHAKQRLISMLEDNDRQWLFWPVYGLLTGWGMKDRAVAEALLPIADWPADTAQYVAHHLPEIVTNRNACRTKLLEIAHTDKLERMDFLAAGYAKLGISHEDAEVVDILLRRHQGLRQPFDGTDRLIAAFGKHPAVRAIAVELIADIEAPWEALFSAYAGDEEIRRILFRTLSSLPSTLRSILVASLERRASDDPDVVRRLSQYRADSNPAVRTASAIAFHEAIRGDQPARKEAMQVLTRDIKSTGPWMDMRAQSALAGLIALDEVSILHDMHGWTPDSLLAIDIFFLDRNRQIVSLVAKHWSQLKAALGQSPLERLTRRGNNEWHSWDQLADHVGESASLRADFLDYCAREAMVLSSRSIAALARELPRSRLLLEHCTRVLTHTTVNVGASPFEHRRRELIVGQVIGRQFSAIDDLRLQLEKRIHRYPSASIVGLSIAWNNSKALTTEYTLLQNRSHQGRYVWPDAAYLVSTLGTPDNFCELLWRLIGNCTGGIWDMLPFCIEPIVERIRSSDELVPLLFQRLRETDNGSEKASLARLLGSANQMNGELRMWCEGEFARQSGRTSMPEFGLDVMAGRIRSVAHAILDALLPNQ